MEKKVRRNPAIDREERIRAWRQKSAAARKRGDLAGMINARFMALGLEPEPDWNELMRTGHFLNLLGFRARSVACMRKAMSLPGHSVAPVRFHSGSDASVLVIGFTVFNGTMAGDGVNFFRAAGLAGCNRITLWDARFQLFLGGLPNVADGYAGLLAYLKAEIARLAPRKLIVTGSSGSAYTALLYGHALGADAVHAFSPPVCLDQAANKILEPRNAKRMRAILAEFAALPLPDPALLDLRTVLRRHNGKSRYFVHYGAAHAVDEFRARLLADCPGVSLVAHPTGNHMVADALAKTGQLRGVFAGELPNP